MLLLLECAESCGICKQPIEAGSKLVQQHQRKQNSKAIVRVHKESSSIVPSSKGYEASRDEELTPWLVFHAFSDQQQVLAITSIYTLKLD